MFFWNCWLRSKFRLIAYVVAACGLTLAGTAEVTMRLVKGNWVWVHPTALRDVIDAWNTGVEHTMLVLIFVMLLMAADLGSRGLGDNAARKECDFLLTRPRSRGHVVWTGWLAGVAQLAAVELAAIIIALGTLFALTSEIRPDRLWVVSLGLWLLSIWVFSSTYALTLATGSTRSGFELAFMLVIIYTAARWIGSYALFYSFFRISNDVYAAGAYDWLLADHQVRYWALLVMAATTIALPFVAQFGFEKKDL